MHFQPPINEGSFDVGNGLAPFRHCFGRGQAPSLQNNQSRKGTPNLLGFLVLMVSATRTRLKITIQPAKCIVQLLIMKLVVQIPAYNESGNLPVVLSEIPRQIPGVDEVIVLVIDDGSTDNTAKVALENGADYVLRHRRNRGLSRAFISGVQFALALGADIIVNTDADNQYPGSEIIKLIAPILADQADMVIGDRQTLDNEHFTKGKRLMEHLGSSIMRRVSKTDVPDAVSGFRAFSRYAALRLQV